MIDRFTEEEQFLIELGLKTARDVVEMFGSTSSKFNGLEQSIKRKISDSVISDPVSGKFAPVVEAFLKTTDSDNNEMPGNVHLTVGQTLVDYYLDAAGIVTIRTGGRAELGRMPMYMYNDDFLTWNREDAFRHALAIVATYR